MNVLSNRINSQTLVRMVLLILLLAFSPGWAGSSARAQEPTQDDQPSSSRPLVVITSYYLNQDTIRPGESFALYLSVKNKGDLTAHNLIFGFSGDDFLPQETGGVIALGSLGSDQARDISQPLLASNTLWGKVNGTVSVRLNYTGPTGEAYSETFTITLDVLGWSGNWATATPTPTSTGVPRAQLVVASYQSDTDPLQPGSIFNLELEVRNLGGGDARDVTMILGGGTSSSAGGESTPQPGGISGAGAELSTFAPIGSSNLQFLGSLGSGATLRVRQQLIVNVSANPGAYTLKLSFVYADIKGNRMVDDQIITLLIYQIPQLEVNFYRDPGPISAMTPNTLPLQVVNLGRKSTVMGNMTVSAENADLMNNVSLIGTLEPGGYFPLDVMYIPQVAGASEIMITINYTDDFNQMRTIEKVIPIQVIEGAVPMPGSEGPGMEAPAPEPGVGPGPEGMPGGQGIGQETFWQAALRFLRGMIGLGSGPAQPGGEEAPPMEPLPESSNPGEKG